MWQRFGIVAFVVSMVTVLLGAVPTSALAAEEMTLFDQHGKPTAYVELDDELTIYLWEGKPVAYLYRDSLEIHVYSFEGEHLGWYDRGIIVDHAGDAVGFRQGAVSTLTALEPLKNLKELRPLKGLRELAPLKPLFTQRWSSIPLVYLLRFGYL